jgi:hypothetical protein
MQHALCQLGAVVQTQEQSSCKASIVEACTALVWHFGRHLVPGAIIAALTAPHFAIVRVDIEG